MASVLARSASSITSIREWVAMGGDQRVDASAQQEPGECRLAPSATYWAFLTWVSYVEADADGAVLAGAAVVAGVDAGAEVAGAEDVAVLAEADVDVVGVGVGEADVGEAEVGDGDGEAEEDRALGDADGDGDLYADADADADAG